LLTIINMNVPEQEVRKILKKHSIRVVDELLTNTKKEAVKAAEKLGFPVVLKISSKDVSHKTEIGGVKTDLRYPKEVEKAFDEIQSNAKKHNVIFEGVLIQKMGEGYEVIVGGKTDQQFGAVVMFGLGGVLVELLKDVSFRICPITKKDAIEMISETKGSMLLEGFRGKPKADIDALADTILKVSKIMSEEKISEMDINPLFVLPEGKGVLAVDFRMTKP